jgi:DNA-binding MarR family transcriptional regulator
MTVSSLLDILKITKQSLSRVLSQLVQEGYISQEQGSVDRRQRLLTLTEQGHEMERLLTETQRKRIARAYRAVGPEAVEGFRAVMLGIMSSDDDRDRFEDRPE